MTSTISQITIRLNGELLSVEQGATLTTLLQLLGRDPCTVAIEHNGEILRRASFPGVCLEEGDQIEIVQFAQGG